jgi:hypothetical protein
MSRKFMNYIYNVNFVYYPRVLKTVRNTNNFDLNFVRSLKNLTYYIYDCLCIIFTCILVYFKLFSKFFFQC